MGKEKMAVWITVLTGLLSLFCALLFALIAEKSRRGTLPRNPIVGIRLPSTMQSDEAWKVAHQRTWIGTALVALLFLVGSIFMLACWEITDISDAVVVAVILSAAVPVLVVQASCAKKAALGWVEAPPKGTDEA